MASLRAPLSRATMYKLYAQSRGPKLCNDTLSRNIGSHALVQRSYATKSTEGVEQKLGIGENASYAATSKSSTASTTTFTSTGASSSLPSPTSSLPADWDDNPNLNLSYNQFDQLPGHDRNFGRNQHMNIDVEFKKAMQQVLWKFRSPIIYSFAYGSGVFPQSKGPAVTPSSKTSIHSNPDPAIVRAQTGGPKMIDFIFGVTDTAHWQSLNIREHRDHYSAIASLGSPLVSWIQDKWGAGVYFNPYVTVNGTLIKYGVVNMDILCRDLSEWDTLYLAGRLHKPVKILRDHPRVRLANQVNLISVLRTALLLLPPTFTEQELYGTIANVSYMGDPRMVLPTEDPSKVANIVGNNLPHFRKLYSPIINNLPNLAFTDGKCSEADWEKDPNLNVRLEQDMDPVKRGNMVRRLPKAFRSKLYFRYQSKFQIPQLEFNAMMEGTKDDDTTRIKRQVGGGFEQRIASQPAEDLRTEVRSVIKQTIGWPSTSQSLKGPVTAGFRKTIRYMSEKMAKYREGKQKAAEAAEEQAKRNARDRVVGKDR